MKFSELSQKAPQIADSFSATASELAERSANRARGGFDEQAYLAANPDVAAAVAAGQLKSGEEHYGRYGISENRALDQQGTTDPLARWKYGDQHWTSVSDAQAADNLYNEIAGITGRIEQYDPKTANQLWRSEGFGSRDRNMQAMVGDLQRYGVNSLSDLKVEERDITKQANFRMGADGRLVIEEERGDSMTTRPATAQELEALKSRPEYAEALAQFKKENSRQRHWDDDFNGVNFTAALPTGQKTGSLINARTGAVIDDNKYNRPLEQGFYIGKTAAGKGKTHFNLYPVATQTPEGGTQYNFIPGTENRATGLKKFMQDWGTVIAVGSLFLGMPGVAAGMGTAGTVAQVGLGTLNAANAFDQGNVLGGIASLAGVAPGVNAVGNLGMSANTLSNINTVGQAANLGQAVQDKNWLGVVGQGAQMAGINSVGSVPVGATLDTVGAVRDKNVLGLLDAGTRATGTQTDPIRRSIHGLAALDAARRGNYLGAAFHGADAAGIKNIPGTEVPMKRARQGAGVYNSLVKKDDPIAAFEQLVEMSGPQQSIRRASGGVVPDLSQYMRTLPNGSRTDKLRGIAAIANGA
jgi:hypothetical protein